MLQLKMLRKDATRSKSTTFFFIFLFKKMNVFNFLFSVYVVFITDFINFCVKFVFRSEKWKQFDFKFLCIGL
ncbi:hypothetical protein HanIR_Chr11g0534151 [Helianthus annuus]|nr:hypothetical protein HanIR_Chr11g0534151 [Helianthus annuus]